MGNFHDTYLQQWPAMPRCEHELAACPFCGASKCFIDGPRHRWVHCLYCGADGPEIKFDRDIGPHETDRRAAAAWNIRTGASP